MRDPFFSCDGATLFLGDCVEVMAEMEPESVDAIVCDPPYDLTADKRGGSGEASVNLDTPYGRSRIGTGNGGGGFMGQAWDSTGVAFDPETWRAALRVLKPGGHLLAFGATRTYHRMACAIEDAGFEIRDSITWLYAEGFPKSLDVAKAIDKHLGAEREVVGQAKGAGTSGNSAALNKGHDPVYDRTAPATPEAQQWEGWGTALKPAHEPIVVGRKPLIGTVAANVLAHGTGAMNIDGCRVSFADEADEAESKNKNRHGDFGTPQGGNSVYGDYSMLEDRTNYDPAGRWPANVMLSHAHGCTPLGGREVRSDGHHPAARGPGGLSTNGHAGQEGLVERSSGTELVEAWQCLPGCPVGELNRQTSEGSRFFFVAKADTGERNRGVERNYHPTVKPVELMQYLVRLVTPPEGTVLDCFAGSGTTLIAARERPGVRAIGIEREQSYCELASRRLAGFEVQMSLL